MLRPPELMLIHVLPICKKRATQNWEGEKKYAREKLDKLFEKLWHEKSFIFVLCFKEILLLLLIPFYPGWKRFFLGQGPVSRKSR